jgi:hypothetical protein
VNIPILHRNKTESGTESHHEKLTFHFLKKIPNSINEFGINILKLARLSHIIIDAEINPIAIGSA